MSSRNFDPLKKSVYVLYENDGDHEVFYNRTSRINRCAFPYVHFKDAVEQAGYNFIPTFDYAGLAFKKDVACIVSLTMLNQTILESVAQHPKEKCILTIEEPWTTYGFMYDKRLTNYFGKIGVMFDHLVDNINYFKFFHPQTNETLAKDIPLFEQKKFCMMIQSNHFCNHPQSEYGERRKAALYFSQKPGELDLYGRGWEGYASWKGWTRTDKVDIIKHYKFTFAYENVSEQYGNISNRLFDCFYAKSIPIYLGPINVNNYVPAKCFINLKDFPSYEELYQYLKNMDRATYEAYIQAGQDYIQSPQAELFSTRQLARNIMEHIPKLT